MADRHPRPRRRLLLAAAELLNAANAVKPLGRRGYTTVQSFAFGWPTSENAPLVITVSALDALRRGIRGDYRSAGGRIRTPRGDSRGMNGMRIRPNYLSSTGCHV